MSMIPGKIEKIVIGNKTRFQSKVSADSGDFFVNFDIESSLEKYIDTDIYDAFLVGLLLRAMKNGEDIIIDGIVSEKLLYNIKNSLMPMQIGVLPGLKQVGIEVSSVRGQRPPGLGRVATGCSGGVDAFYTIAYHLSDLVTEGYKLNSFLFNYHGAEKAKALSDDRFKIVKSYADNVNIDILRVDTNLVKVSPFNYQESNNYQHMAAVLFLQNVFSKYYFSSSVAFCDSHLQRINASAYSDPFAIPLFSTEATETIPFGALASRPEKTLFITNYEPTKSFLNVCVTYHPEGKNCSVCRKCCRTLLTFDIYGKMHEYEKVFDLKAYEKAKNWHIYKIFRNKNYMFNREIIDLAKEKAYKFPLGPVLIAKTINVIFPFKLEKTLDKLFRLVKGYFKKKRDK